MQFKTTRQEQEWRGGRLDVRAAALVLLVCGYAEMRGWPEVVVTSIYRPNQRSVHGHWRAVDLRTSHWRDARTVELVSWLNSLFIYGSRYQVAVYHNVGQGWHLHLQVPPWRGAGRPRIRLYS